MNLKKQFACLAAVLALGANACEDSHQGASSTTPHWTYAKVCPDGTRIRTVFRANDQGEVVHYSTETQTAQGEFYFGKGTPTTVEVATLQRLTTRAAIEALRPNLVLSHAVGYAQRTAHEPGPADVSLWPQGCAWPETEHCHQVLGSVSMTPQNPAVEELDAFFVQFTQEHRGKLATPVNSSAAGVSTQGF